MHRKFTIAHLFFIGVLGCFSPALAGDPFTILPGGIADGSEPPPELAGQGPARPGTKNTLRVTQAPPQRGVHLVVGMSLLDAPFAGGILGPAPQIIATIGRTSADGSLAYSFRMPVTAPPGLSIWTQAWMRASGAPEGLAATNTLGVSVQPELPLSQLFPLATYPMGLSVREIAAADLNGDGLTDIVSANEFSIPGEQYGDVSVRLATSSGAFGAVQSLEAEGDSFAGVTGVAIGDVIGGDELDIVVANESAGEIAIFPGLGLGLFGDPVHEPVSPGGRHVALADFDGDGHVDIAAASEAEATLSVLLRVDGGALHPAVNSALSGSPTAIALGDLNLDQVPDLALVDSINNQLVIHYGDGAGGLSTEHVLPIQPGSPRDVLIANLDADPRNEVVVVKGGANSVLVYDAGDGEEFTLASTIAAGIGARSAHLADVDGDGDLDLSVARSAVHRVTVLRGVSAGYFEVAESYSVALGSTDESSGVVSADVDQDGCLDLVAGTSSAMTVILADAQGALFAGSSLEVNGTSSGVAAGDFDADGIEDYAVSGLSTGVIRLFRGTSSGPEYVSETVVGTSPYALAAADLNEDGVLDLAVSHFSEGEGIWILEGVGDFSFSVQHVVLTGPAPIEVRLADVTGDGVLDLVTTDFVEDRLSILPGNGDGTFAPAVELEICERPSGLVVDDLSGDGQPDIAVACSLDNTIRVLTNAGAGALSGPVDYPGGLSPRYVSAFDVDGDGDLDLLAVSSGGFGVAFLKNAGDGTFPGSASLIPTDGAVGSMVFADVTGDGTGDLILVPGSAIVLPGLGGGLFGDPIRFGGAVAADDAIATDLDGDGDVDLMIPDVASVELGIAVLENQLIESSEPGN